jgi:hypothetical protein
LKGEAKSFSKSLIESYEPKEENFSPKLPSRREEE